MTPEMLLDAIGQVDEELLVKTEKGARISPRRISGFIALAACLCIIVGIGLMPRGLKSAVEEAPAAEAPFAEPPEDEMPAATPEMEEPAGEDPEPTGGGPSREGRLWAVLVQSEYTDDETAEAVKALCDEHSINCRETTLYELSTYLNAGGNYVIIADELRYRTAKLEKKYPYVCFLDPNDVINGALDEPYPKPEYHSDRVRVDGNFMRCILLDGVEYLPIDYFIYDVHMMNEDRKEPYADIEAHGGEATLRVNDTEYELENAPFLYIEDGWDEQFYVPAEEFGTLLGLDVSRDPDTGVLNVAQPIRTAADFQGTKTLILRYGPGTTTEELKEHLQCLYDNRCPLGRLSDLRNLEEGDTMVCIVLEPGSFTDFGSLQAMQHDVTRFKWPMQGSAEENGIEWPVMCLAIDPANLGGISEEDLYLWDWNHGLPYYYCLTGETAQLPAQERDAAIRSSMDFIRGSVERSTRVVICPKDCRSLLHSDYILDEEGMWLHGERIETVYSESVTPDMHGEDLLRLMNEFFDN